MANAFYELDHRLSCALGVIDAARARHYIGYIDRHKALCDLLVRNKNPRSFVRDGVLVS